MLLPSIPTALDVIWVLFFEQAGNQSAIGECNNIIWIES